MPYAFQIIFAITTSLVTAGFLHSNQQTSNGYQFDGISFLILCTITIGTILIGIVTGKSKHQQPITQPNSTTAPSSERYSGTIKWFNFKKGFGFISQANGEEIFVHFRALEHGDKRALQEGQQVEFDITETDKGLQAERVVVIK